MSGLSPGSRYHALDTATWRAPDGRAIAYKRRRLLPRLDAFVTIAEVEVAAGDRLDRIATTTLGDPEQFWRLCDANDVLAPSELERPGTVIRVPMPRP